MNTPPNVLRMLAAIRDEGHNLQKEDPHDMLEKAYNLGYEEESMWFYEWAEGIDPASDLNTKPSLNVDKYMKAVNELDASK